MDSPDDALLTLAREASEDKVDYAEHHSAVLDYLLDHHDFREKPIFELRGPNIRYNSKAEKGWKYFPDDVNFTIIKPGNDVLENDKHTLLSNAEKLRKVLPEGLAKIEKDILELQRRRSGMLEMQEILKRPVFNS